MTDMSMTHHEHEIAYSGEGISVAGLLGEDVQSPGTAGLPRSRSRASVYACERPCIAVALVWSEFDQAVGRLVTHLDAVWSSPRSPVWRMVQSGSPRDVRDSMVFGSASFEFRHEASVLPGSVTIQSFPTRDAGPGCDEGCIVLDLVEYGWREALRAMDDRRAELLHALVRAPAERSLTILDGTQRVVDHERRALERRLLELQIRKLEMDLPDDVWQSEQQRRATLTRCAAGSR